MNLPQVHKSFQSDHIQTNFPSTYNQFTFRSQSLKKKILTND